MAMEAMVMAMEAGVVAEEQSEATVDEETCLHLPSLRVRLARRWRRWVSRRS